MALDSEPVRVVADLLRKPSLDQKIAEIAVTRDDMILDRLDRICRHRDGRLDLYEEGPA